MEVNADVVRVVAQIVPVFLVVALFEPLRLRRDHRSHRDAADLLLVALPTGVFMMLALLGFSFVLLMYGEPYSGLASALYLALLAVSFVTLAFVLLGRIQYLRALHYEGSRPDPNLRNDKKPPPSEEDGGS